MFSPIFLLQILIGFFVGSIIPTSYGLVSKYIPWNNLYILLLILCLEVGLVDVRCLRSVKLGFLFGLFVDAFKVGS